MTDTDLITGLKDGNEQAYRFLYENYYAMLCHFSENLLKDRFLAESVVGEVIFNVYNKRGSLEITGKVSNYLLKSVRNRSLNYLNSRHVRKTMSIGEDFPVFDYLEESELPHAKLVRKELEEEIEKSIATLPEQTRKVFCQSRFEYKDYEEIAAEDGISVNTVKYHIKKALAHLRGDVGKYWALLVAVKFLMH